MQPLRPLPLYAALLIGLCAVAAGAAAPDTQPTELAQAAADDMLVEESAPPTVSTPDTARKSPAPVPAKSAAATKSTVKTKSATAAKPSIDARNLLIEEGESPIVEEAPPPADVPASAAADTTPRSAPVAAPAPTPSARPAPAQLQAEDGGLVEEGGTIAPAQKPAAAARTTEVVVTESRSINFAENLHEYRSPKLAMLLSLVVPGLGQAYAKRYWKTGLFLAIEAGAIATSIGFYNKGKKLEKKAHRYADEHYSVDSFRVYYDSLWHAIKDAYRDPDPAYAPTYADSILRTDVFLFYDSTFDTTTFRRMYEKRGSNTEFYNYIEDNKFVYGWKDAYPSLTGFNERAVSGQIDTAYTSGDTLILTSPATGDSIYYKYDMYVNGDLVSSRKYGFSQYYTTYKNILSDRDAQHRIAGNILYVVLLNHIVSAVDAGLTAKAHNDRLLGKESLWRRIHVDPAWVDAGAGAALGAVVTFDF